MDWLPSHERLALLFDSRFKDRFSLSTSRLWNLFRLPWLPFDELALGGGLPPLLPALLLLVMLTPRVGLVTRELCDARDDVLVIARFCMRCVKAAIEGLPYAGALAELGDVERLVLVAL